jgi:predicted esterase
MREYEPAGPLVYVGFSQGVAMAYRATAFAHDHGDVPRAAGAIVLAGDIPPDVVPRVRDLPPLLIGRGTGDEWYTEAKAGADLRHLAPAVVSPRVHVFEGGHVWDESFVAAAGEFLDLIAASPRGGAVAERA